MLFRMRRKCDFIGIMHIVYIENQAFGGNNALKSGVFAGMEVEICIEGRRR
jgi:hypothetical protein